MAARHCGADRLHGHRLGEADDEPGEHGAGNAADAAEDRRRKQRQQEVEPHLRADLHQRARR